MRPSTTAILLFARSTAREIHEKWLPGGKEIYPLLNGRAKRLAEESGLPFFHITEQEQVGSDFGSRFSHALQQIFAQGYSSVISIGNDTPQMTQNDIQTALAHITDQNSVIGPSRDGGIYLLGIHASDFDAQEFKKLKWCTSQVQSNLAIYFKTRGKELKALCCYRDLDSASDIVFLSDTRYFIPFGILNILRKALQPFARWFDSDENLRSQALCLPYHNKGSPI